MDNVSKESIILDPIERMHERVFSYRKMMRNKRADIIFRVVIIILSLLMIIPLIAILSFITYKGISHIRLDLFLNDQRNHGFLNALIGSGLIVLIASIIAIPISVLTGLYLSESTSRRIPDIVRLIVDVLQGVPSIILGIVAYTWLVVPLRSFSGLAGGVALSMMMLPIIIKSTEENLKLVPQSLREAGYALGVPRYIILLQVVLPAGISGVTTGILVALSRILGESAPLLFTAFGGRDVHFNLLKPMEALPPMIYKYATSPVQEWIDAAWAASLVLVVFVLILNLLIRLVTNKWKVKF
jgi:phosphate transport system permease protein